MILDDIFKFLNNYRSFLDSFICDFYIADLWSTIPRTWQLYFDTISISQVAYFIGFSSTTASGDAKTQCFPAEHGIPPLSLLAFRVSCQVLSLPRTSKDDFSGILNLANCNTNASCSESVVKNPRLNVKMKLKKRHEGERFGGLISLLCNANNCTEVIDYGSGMGHLARILAVQYGLRVSTVEANEALVNSATKLDSKILKIMGQQVSLPEHSVSTIDDANSLNTCMASHQRSSGRRCLVGLHACGNLSTCAIKQFCTDSSFRCLALISCCYMKLNEGMEETVINLNTYYPVGYPLSKYTIDLGEEINVSLSYCARESACHAIEKYVQKLRNHSLSEDSPGASITHCYRAILEFLIVKKYVTLRHQGLKSVKNINNLTFEQVVKIATENRNDINIEPEFIEIYHLDIKEFISKWKRIIFYYVIKLMLAPVVESVILIDRLSFLTEHGICAEIVPIFDPLISPRNYVLIAVKDCL